MAIGKLVAYTETVVRNLQDREVYYGFLPPHGKRLAANGDADKGDYFSFQGSIDTFIGRRKRYADAFRGAVDDGLIRVTENKRRVYYAAVDDEIAFSVGDLLYWDNSAKLAVPAAETTWDTNLATTQANFANVFLGVCLDDKADDDGVELVRVDVSPWSYHDISIAAGTAYQIGQTFGPAKDTGNALLSNKVVAAVAASSVARLAADITDADTQILIAVASAWIPQNSAAAM